jgi:hypothetical protein
MFEKKDVDIESMFAKKDVKRDEDPHGPASMGLP